MQLFLTKEEANTIIEALNMKDFFEPSNEPKHHKIVARIQKCLDKQQR